MLDEAAQRAQALHRLARARHRPRRRPHARRADRGRRHVRPRAAARAGQGADPHVGHDRHAEGREPQAAAVARPGRRAAGEDPAQGARADDDRRADVPLLGLRALHARDGPVLDDRAQAQVRPRGDALAHRAARVHRADRRAGDAAADPRARRRGAAALRPLAREGRARVGLRAPRRRSRSAGWTCSATTSTTSTARPRWRGRRSPRPEDLRAAPGTAGRPPRGTVVKLYDEDGNPVAPGETGRIFVGNELAFEGYTGGGNKAAIDGPAVVRRRRPLRPRRAAVHRRPRRRHDRLGRRERVPGRGRGPARRARGDRRGRRLRRRRTRSSGSGSRRSSCCARGTSLEVDEIKAFVKANLAGYKVPRDVEFVDELPRTSTGKVLKRELRDA